jgi:F-type H+-transporting ATPase subunit b
MFCPISAVAAEAEPAEGGWFPVIFYAINFLLFLWIVRRYGWPTITRFFRDRANTIRQNRGRAEKAYAEARELANRGAELLRQLEAEKSRIAAELDQETAFQIGRIQTAAQEAVNRIRRDSQIALVALHEAAQRRLRHSLAVAAGAIARELLRRNFQTTDQGRLLQSFVERIGQEARG